MAGAAVHLSKKKTSQPTLLTGARRTAISSYLSVSHVCEQELETLADPAVSRGTGDFNTVRASSQTRRSTQAPYVLARDHSRADGFSSRPPCLQAHHTTTHHNTTRPIDHIHIPYTSTHTTSLIGPLAVLPCRAGGGDQRGQPRAAAAAGLEARQPGLPSRAAHHEARFGSGHARCLHPPEVPRPRHHPARGYASTPHAFSALV